MLMCVAAALRRQAAQVIVDYYLILRMLTYLESLLFSTTVHSIAYLHVYSDYEYIYVYVMYVRDFGITRDLTYYRLVLYE